MTSDQENAKNQIATATQLARQHGVEVLGWNDKPGRESISVNGEGDKLLALQTAMEKSGWHTWPVTEDQEGAFMDFALRPPPVVAPATTTSEVVDEDLAEAAAVAKPTFYYARPGSLFRTQWWLAIIHCPISDAIKPNAVKSGSGENARQ